jgi:hypothetical protein
MATTLWRVSGRPLFRDKLTLGRGVSHSPRQRISMPRFVEANTTGLAPVREIDQRKSTASRRQRHCNWRVIFQVSDAFPCE